MKKIQIIVVLIIAFSCKDNIEQREYPALKTYNIGDITEQTMEGMFDQAINIDIVPLETNENCFISRCSDVKSVKDKIYIYDERQHTVFIFDRKGLFINKVSNRGRSKSEYLTLRSFDINDESGEIVILDNMSYKLLVYSALGDFVKYIDLKYKNNYTDISFLTDSTFCLFSRGSSHKSDFGNDNMVYVFDNNGNLIAEELMFSKSYNEIVYTNGYEVITYRNSNNDLCMKFPFDNRVFTKTKDSLYCNVDIKFNGYDDPDKMFKYVESIAEEGMEYIIENTNIMLTGLRFIEKENYILSDVNHGDMTPKYILYNKQTDKSILYDFGSIPVLHALIANNGLNIYNGSDNQLITISDPSFVCKYLPKEVPDNASENIRTVVTKLQQLAIDPKDNPILIFFELTI